VKIVASILGLMTLVLCFAVRTSAGPTEFRFGISSPSNFTNCDCSGKICCGTLSSGQAVALAVDSEASDGQDGGSFAILRTVSLGSWNESVRHRAFDPDLRAERRGGSEDDREFIQSPKSPTPEPSTLFLIGTGLVGFAAILRRRSRDRNAQDTV
jgi:hypothetical protein